MHVGIPGLLTVGKIEKLLMTLQLDSLGNATYIVVEINDYIIW